MSARKETIAARSPCRATSVSNADVYATGASRPALLRSGFFLCHPIATLRLAVALRFRFALDGVATDFAGVFGHDLVVVEFACHLKGDFVAFDFAFLDGGVVLAPRHGAGQLVTFGLEFEGVLADLAVLVGGAGFPGAGDVNLLVLRARRGREAKREREAGSPLNCRLEGSLHNVCWLDVRR